MVRLRCVCATFLMMDKNPDGTDTYLVRVFHHGFPFFLYAFFCLVSVVLVWGWVPETKGRSLEQIEEHWIRK